MSALAAPLAPTIWTQVAGTALPLPATARTDLAFLWEYTFGTLTGSIGPDETIGGDYYEIPLFATVELTSDATTGTRAVFFIVSDTTETAVIVVPPYADQGPSLTRRYQFYVGTGTAYGPIGNTLVAVIPPAVVTPGYHVGISNQEYVGSGDYWSSGVLQTLRIPTGPNVQSSSGLTATPILA